MRIGLVGTRGVPANYGGFETCVEEVGVRLAEAGHEVIVYSRRPARAVEPLPKTYRGMQNVELPALRRRSLETPTHTMLSVLHLLTRPRLDAVLLFNAANAFVLPVLRLRRIPVATHVDGLEWRRAKWGPTGQRFYRVSESLAVRWSDALIADAQGISDYYAAEFSAPSELIQYGAPILDADDAHLLAPLGIAPHRYHLVVARFEPENHVDVIVDGYVRSSAEDPLIVVGSVPYARESEHQVRQLADDRVRFLGAVWDQDLLNALYANSLAYFHGHSVGGTNPSLLRAIGGSAATNAFDVVFNREVLGETGRYWRTADEVADLVAEAEADRDATIERGRLSQKRAKEYDWDDVATRYELLCTRLAGRQLIRPRLSGRRNNPGWSDRTGVFDGSPPINDQCQMQR